MNQFVKALLFLNLASFCLLFPILAQDSSPYKDVAIASPNAASLGKYGDIPVNFHTGVPQISIPFYTIEEGPLSLPINISYHASGLKVMEPASSIGAGWSLNAGGVITRTVRGASDERYVSRADQEFGFYTNYGYDSYLYKTSGSQQVMDWHEFAIGRKDGEPDLFFFNFNGHSGKFYFRQDRTPVIIPEQDLKIIPNYPLDTKNFESFVIVTPDGTRYHFGTTEFSKEISRPMDNTDNNKFLSMKVVSSWYLTKIESADEKFHIDLSYERENYSYYTLSMFPTVSPHNDQIPEHTKLIKNYIDGARLGEISFSNKKVSFLYAKVREDLSKYSTDRRLEDELNVEAKALTTIRLFHTDSNVDDLCKEFVFEYDYFYDQTTLLKGKLGQDEITYNLKSDKKRLKLNKIRERSCDNTVVVPAYEFLYYDVSSVPRRLAYSQDHWGFNNGAVNNTGLIPNVSLNGEEYSRHGGVDREASWPFMRAGTLMKIVYPTGGNTNFEYGPHDAGYQDDYFTRDKSTTLASVQVGFGSEVGISKTVNIASKDIFYASVSASSGSSGGSLNISNNNGQFYSIAAGPGQTKTEFIEIEPGTYTVYALSPYIPGQGATGELATTKKTFHSDEVLIGGLRVAKITTHDGISYANDKVKAFQYETDGVSHGVLYSRPTYVGTVRNDILIKAASYVGGADPNKFGCDIRDGEAFYFISPSSIFPMSTTQGNHIGYSKVVINNPDGAYTLKKYFNSGNASMNKVSERIIDKTVCDPFAPNYPPAPIKHNFKRGELEYEGYFSSNGNILKEIFYTPEYEEEILGVHGLIVVPYATSFLATEYEYKTGRKVSLRREERTYNPKDITQEPLKEIEIVKFESDRHHQPTANITTYPDRTNTINTTYVADIEIPSCNYVSACEQNLNNSTLQYYQAYQTAFSACSTDACKKEAYLEYRLNVKAARLVYLNCRSTFNANLKNCLESAYAPADLFLKSVLDLQASNQVLPIEISQWNGEALTKSNYFKYATFHNNKKQSYVKEIYQINPKASTVFSPISNNQTAITTDSDYKYFVGYNYNNGGRLTEIKPREGILSSFIWDPLNMYPLVKASGVGFDILNSTYNSVGGDMNALRDHTNLKDALISSYTYKPLTGMSSEMDSNKKTQTYFYDKLGRLDIIKDNDGNIIKDFHFKYNIQ